MRFQWSKTHTSAGKPSNPRACVTKSHSSGPVPVQHFVQLRTFRKFLGAECDVLIPICFLDEFVEIVKPIRVQQPQASEMACYSQLLGSSREEQEAWYLVA